ncbi:MAG: glutamyl-tRNA reductase [Dehalococcoidales bacterium]|nr:glutamyl-tRNA reductase [Dehalococcoidales bacterium]
MDICLVGINHFTAPISIREKAAIRPIKLSDALQSLYSCIPYGVILSTCNRTEIYTTPNGGGDARTSSLKFLNMYLGITDTMLFQYTYSSLGEAAVEHLFRIASGLDSMIIGEYEVLGQVRQALATAEKAKMIDLPLRHLFQSAIRTGRRVREETFISKNALSISSVAVGMAARVVRDFKNSRLLVIGAGEAGALVAKAACDRGLSNIVVASRSQERASSLTDMLGGMPIRLNDIGRELAICDIVVTCADAPHCLLGAEQVEAAMKSRPETPMVIIDIAVPRNVDPEISRIDNVFLYNIDDLSITHKNNRQQREAEISKAEAVIAMEMDKFDLWWQDYKIRPVVRSMMIKAEKIRYSHLEKTVQKMPLLSDEEKYRLEKMTKAIVGKILIDPVNALKKHGHDDNSDYLKIVEELFHLKGVVK